MCYVRKYVYLTLNCICPWFDILQEEHNITVKDARDANKLNPKLIKQPRIPKVIKKSNMENVIVSGIDEGSERQTIILIPSADGSMQAYPYSSISINDAQVYPHRWIPQYCMNKV